MNNKWVLRAWKAGYTVFGPCRRCQSEPASRSMPSWRFQPAYSDDIDEIEEAS